MQPWHVQSRFTEMVRKWWVSRQIIRSKISKCRILGLKPSVFEINCHLGLTPSVFKKKFPSVDTAGRPRWCLPVARPIRSRHFRPLRADPPEPPAASGDPAGSPSALGFGPRRRRTLGYLAYTCCGISTAPPFDEVEPPLFLRPKQNQQTSALESSGFSFSSRRCFR